MKVLARRVGIAVLAAGALLAVGVPAASANEWGNLNWEGLLSASPPTGFPVSPASLDLSSGPANFTLGVPVQNLTGSDQTVQLKLQIWHILTFQGQNIGDGQPGQAGISFPHGTAQESTQVQVSTIFETFTVPAGGGTDVLNFPATITQCGYYQLDVHDASPTNHTALAVGFTRALGCQLAPRLTPGYWKTHSSATTALLPQTLGNYTVDTFAKASDTFDAMKCNQPANCLAGHLLAAQLDVASGASSCINPTIQAANAFLVAIGYAGPQSYTLTSTQAAQALSLETTLDNYTNDSTSATC